MYKKALDSVFNLHIRYVDKKQQVLLSRTNNDLGSIQYIYTVCTNMITLRIPFFVIPNNISNVAAILKGLTVLYWSLWIYLF